MIKKLLFAVILAFTMSCSTETKQTLEVYKWCGWPNGGDEEDLKEMIYDFKEKGITGLFFNAGFDTTKIKIAGKYAKDAGLDFHTWIPTMVQQKNDQIDSSWYIVSREGKSALEKPAFVDYYRFLCPNREEVFQYLSKKYLEVAALKDVDGVHLDYIRYPDVYLARGLWDKYGLNMTEEFAPFDYCYCDKCVADFKAKTGLDIRELGDSAQNNEQWRQFRYDIVTKFVNRLADDVHATNKKISAAVFPGPSLAKKMVRQDWGKWNLDMVAPMLYNDFYLEDIDWIGEMTKEGVESTKDIDNKFISGIFVCSKPEKKANEKDPEGHGLIPGMLEPAIDRAMENGADAICIFGGMTPEHWTELKTTIEKYNK